MRFLLFMALCSSASAIDFNKTDIFGSIGAVGDERKSVPYADVIVGTRNEAGAVEVRTKHHVDVGGG